MKRKFRFTIANRLGLGFGILIIAVLYTSLLTYNTLNKNLQANSLITDIYNPSTSYLHDLHFMITNSKMLIKNWVHIDKKNDTPDKMKLKQIHQEKYPQLKRKLAPLVNQWQKKDRKEYRSLLLSIDSLFTQHTDIMQSLNSFEQYDNPMVILIIQPLVEDKGEVVELTDRVLLRLDKLVKSEEYITEQSNTKMEAAFAEFSQLILYIGIILIISVLIIAAAAITSITSPIRYIKKIILKMSKGILPEQNIRSRSDEIGEMAEALNELVMGLKKTSDFSLEIGKENFECQFSPLGDDDMLGNSLLLMRENLLKAKTEDEKRKKEDFQRNWTSQGVALFGEILRQSNDDIKEFGLVIIKNLVKYLDSNQGGLFIINDDKSADIFIELVAAFAYDRNKSEEKRIELGEGLIGRCVQENETVFMTDIPKNYVRITSGLGNDNPRNLLIVPLILNEKVYGVVELASFKIYESYQIEFVEKIGESIASTIANVKISLNTAQLLRESQYKSEQLAEQEEIMRQTMELMEQQQQEAVEDHQINLKETQKEYEEQLIKLNQKFAEEKVDLNNEIIKYREKLREL